MLRMYIINSRNGLEVLSLYTVSRGGGITRHGVPVTRIGLWDRLGCSMVIVLGSSPY